MELANIIPEVPQKPTPVLTAVPPAKPPPRQIWKAFRHFLLGVLLPILWVSLTPPFQLPYKPMQRSRQLLKEDSAALHAYFDKYRKNPADLNILRSFAYGNHLPFTAYDAFGARIDYLRLDDQHFLLRSFGEDQVQNSLNTPADLGIINWGERPDEPLTYTYTETPNPSFYQAALLAGTDAPQHQWLARLYADDETSQRHLVVRHLLRDGLFMVAPHDEVEEFLWLPDGDRLVFTATGSTRYRDGLYLWDLRTDLCINLLDTVHAQALMGSTQGPEIFWLSLAGVSSRGPLIYAYLRPRQDGSLSPLEFFSHSSMVAIAVPAELGARPRLATPDEFPASVDAVSLRRPFPVDQHLGGKGIHVQREWAKLPNAGDMEQVLLAWHAVSDDSLGSPLFPYSLWLLSTFYAESFAVLKASGRREQEALRSYGTEVARALLNYPLAPTYLKGLAMFAYGDLMDGQILPYHLARFTSNLGPSFEEDVEEEGPDQ